MNCNYSRLISITLVLFYQFNLQGNDTLSYRLSLAFYKDLSDTYYGGDLLAGEFKLCKTWYGGEISYGQFQSANEYNYEITIEEINSTVTIPINEVTVMKSGSLSFFIRPVKYKWIATDLSLGLVYCRAYRSRLINCYYSYDLINKEFVYLYREYALENRTHFGFQVGVDINFISTHHLGLDLKARIQNLNHGGTFFFVGGGISVNF